MVVISLVGILIQGLFCCSGIRDARNNYANKRDLIWLLAISIQLILYMAKLWLLKSGNWSHEYTRCPRFPEESGILRKVN